MYRPKLTGLSDSKRASISMRYRRIDEVMQTGGSLSRFMNKADAIMSPLTTKREQLTAAATHTTAGIAAELEQPRAETRAELAKLQESIQAQANKVAQQAQELESRTFAFDDTAKADIDLFLKMAPDQRQNIIHQCIAGKHPDLARSLVAAPEWSLQNSLTTHAREVLRSKLIPVEEQTAILDRARNHAAVLDHVADMITEIDQM